MRDNGRSDYKIWRDGDLVAWNDATIHVMSHVVHYGSGVFEGIRAYETPAGPAIFRLRDHMRRLLDSCKIYRMSPRHTLDELISACVETVSVNRLDACYVRPIVIRTGEQMGVVAPGVPIETFIIARPWGTYLGEDGVTNGVDVCVSSWRRSAPDTFPTLAKASGNYLSAQLARMEAQAAGYSEGIMLDTYGFVAEGSGENLFLVRDGVLYTSPVAAAILSGITRDTVNVLAREMGVEIRTENMLREMLYTADELFFTGTAAEITPIRSVDKIQVGSGTPGPITRALQEQFMGIAKGRIPDRHGWLTLVPQGIAAAAI